MTEKSWSWESQLREGHEALSELLRSAALLWVENADDPLLPSTDGGYSTVLNRFLWAAEQAYGDVAAKHRPPSSIPVVMKGEHIVYRAFDNSGDILYIGVTSDFPRRISRHQTRAPWWKWCVDVTVEFFDSRPAANDAERESIYLENPPFNRVGVPSV